ncbi:uncharacterized protein VICG_01050 [Vittaforma corneae ATCC 50505]|uniref:Uncharacterized protein n=1 Tax=Vittaforma corneae (strain ATCC 50505) TaxID=993615 RepID=L2GLZ2_VITCO|nr:uncharacterized protein VICG_01050 [Vittaforma corneae ATCC 50505]ELA41866.1 hypothetical protein VICG_01050 [Vittaforma corneae ATCC 50505]
MVVDNTAKECKEKIKSLEKIIADLKSELHSKEIIINALVSKLKEQKSGVGCENCEHAKKIKTKMTVSLPGIEACSSEDINTEAKTPISPRKPADGSFHKSVCTPCDSAEIISQIKDIFVQKSKNMEFKLNFTFKKFVDYAETTYEFSLFNKKVMKAKNPLKQFIEANLDRIVKYILDNVNTLNLNQICSTIFLINSEMAYKHKLVIFHDIVLELSSHSKLNLIAAALFNNLDLENDVFSQVIKKIMYHQLCIDGNILKDSEVAEHLNLIRDNFNLSTPEISLWESLSHFLVKHRLFDQDRKIILADSIERGFCLRMLCHYIDWDYTYNTFILTQLYPKILSDKGAVHVYYLGILMMNARRVFGYDESVERLEEELVSFLEWKDECSVVAYMILKQVRQTDSESWMNENEEFLQNNGYRIEYLRSFLLL